MEKPLEPFEKITYKLDVFEGPLDLLLHLIEKHKINIYDIPIVTITEQFLDYMSRIEQDDPEKISSFIVMAAMLLRIKSKMLLPTKDDGEENIDPRDELVARLLEYQRFRMLSQELKDRQIGASYVLYRTKQIPEEVSDFREEPNLDLLLKGVTLARLTEVFEEVMRRSEEKIDPIRSRFGKIEREPVSLAERMQELENRLVIGKKVSFAKLLGQERTKGNIIMTFLAVLELMKRGSICAVQEHIFGEIQVEKLNVPPGEENAADNEVEEP